MTALAPKYVMLFFKTWLGIGTAITVSNVVTSKWAQDKALSDTAVPTDVIHLGISSRIFISTLYKGIPIGCPLLFFPNMAIRLSQSLAYRDFNYMIPPFYYMASDHPKYKKYSYKSEKIYFKSNKSGKIYF